MLATRNGLCMECAVILKYSRNTTNLIDQGAQAYPFDSTNGNAKTKCIDSIVILSRTIALLRLMYYYRD